MARKPLIVIDTNALVSGLRSRQGWSFILVSQIGNERFDHCISASLALEYEEVLKRESVSLGLEFSDIDDFIDRIIQTGTEWLLSTSDIFPTQTFLASASARRPSFV